MAHAYNCFTYDGTLEGLLCTIVKCINMRVMPREIKPEFIVTGRIGGMNHMHITSDFKLADKFYRYIGQIASVALQQMILDFFLTSIPSMEIDMFLMICKALKYGARVAEDFEDETMNRIQMSIRDLYREVHTSVSEISFKAINDVDVSVINPRNCILPIAKKNILSKSDYDDVMLYDKRHRLLLMKNGDREQIIDTTILGGRISDIYSENTPDSVYKNMWNYFTSYDHIRDLSAGSGYKSANSLTRLWYIAV